MESLIERGPSSRPALHLGQVESNVAICRDHFLMTLSVSTLESAKPGQFVHLGAPAERRVGAEAIDSTSVESSQGRRGQGFDIPFLRRAFSMAGLRRSSVGVEIDVLYRTVGVGTCWLAACRPGDSLSVMGPLGNGFADSLRASSVMLVAGGVGLPPLLWLADWIHRGGGRAVGVAGAVSADLVPVPDGDRVEEAAQIDNQWRGSVAAPRPTTRWLVATDDGTYGFRGNAADAFRAVYDRLGSDADEWTVCTCGPEAMMRSVGEYCVRQSIACFVCLERAMSCGTGTCQSCVVAIDDERAPDGWRYQLCCTDGPVFEGSKVRW